MKWKRGIQFTPFEMDAYGAYTTKSEKTADQFSEFEAIRFYQSITPRHPKILQALSIDHISASATLPSSRRPDHTRLQQGKKLQG